MASFTFKLPMDGMGRRGIVSGRRKSSRSVRTSTPARFCMLRSRRLLNASGAETGTAPSNLVTDNIAKFLPRNTLPDCLVFLCINLKCMAIALQVLTCKMHENALFLNVKYTNFPGDNTPGPRGGRSDPLPHLPPAQGASTPRSGHRSSARTQIDAHA